MICPDIYFPNFSEWCERYQRNGNPLFIPEMAASARAPANALYAIAHFGAIGVAPFSIENISQERESEITAIYSLLCGLSKIIADCQQHSRCIGLSPEIQFDWTVGAKPTRAALGGIIFDARFDSPAAAGNEDATVLPTLGLGKWDAPPQTPLGAAMILQIAGEEFIIAAMGATITFSPTDKNGKIGIESSHEGYFDDASTWIGARWLSGDETHQGRHVHFPTGRWTLQRVKLYRYA
jgi:hypothetical protein